MADGQGDTTAPSELSVSGGDDSDSQRSSQWSDHSSTGSSTAGVVYQCAECGTRPLYHVRFVSRTDASVSLCETCERVGARSADVFDEHGVELPAWTHLAQADDDVVTETSLDQAETEDACAPWMAWAHAAPADVASSLKLHRVRHKRMLLRSLAGLPAGYASLDASRPWLVYWIVHSLHLLGHDFTSDQRHAVASFLAACQHEDGGFAGGPMQAPHLAPTYAAVNALATVGGEAALRVVDRVKLLAFLRRLHTDSGAFRIHDDGEIDIRATYCALNVAVLTNILTPDLVRNTASFLRTLQTYEGGMGGFRGNEAHGGYAFCGLAAMMLLDAADTLDVPAFTAWLVARQMAFEGGFQGRCNKLVDSCYSFWQGGAFPLIAALSAPSVPVSVPGALRDWPMFFLNAWHSGGSDAAPEYLLDTNALQHYLLLCAQAPGTGGFRDKPGKSIDAYHTCYSLSGLATAQHNVLRGTAHVLGGEDNAVAATHPLFNIGMEPADAALAYYRALPVPE